MRKDLGPRCYEFGCQNLAILILGMILAKIVPKIFSLGGGRSRISALVRNIFVATRIQTAPQTALKLVKYQSSSSQRTQRQHPQFRAGPQPHQQAPLLLPASPQQGVPTTQSEPPTTQARRCASSSTLADATKEQSATLSTSAGSQAVVETPPPRPAQVLHQWLPELQRTHTTLQHSNVEHKLRLHPDKAWVTWLLDGIDNGVSIDYTGSVSPLRSHNPIFCTCTSRRGGPSTDTDPTSPHQDLNHHLQLLLTRALAPSTCITTIYATCVRRYQGLCHAFKLIPVPAMKETITLFAVHLSQSMNPRTLQVYVAAVSFLHHSLGYKSPASRNPMLRLAIRVSNASRDPFTSGLHDCH
ncbi:hypothetical protein EMCRGX_G007706 [Ephydatia muelleri]